MIKLYRCDSICYDKIQERWVLCHHSHRDIFRVFFYRNGAIASSDAYYHFTTGID